MGKFANEMEGGLSHLGPVGKKPQTSKVVENGFEALGHPVPMYRR